MSASESNDADDVGESTRSRGIDQREKTPEATRATAVMQTTSSVTLSLARNRAPSTARTVGSVSLWVRSVDMFAPRPYQASMPGPHEI